MRAKVGVGAALLVASTAGASEQDWSGDHWGVFVARTSAAAHLSTSPDLVQPGYDPASGTFFQASTVAAVSVSGRGGVSSSGSSAGIAWGRDWQSGRTVTGIELDLGRLHVGGSRSAGDVYPCCAPTGYQVVQAIHADWAVTARGRVGYAFKRSLVYATAGLLVAKVRVDGLFIDDSENARGSTSLSTIRLGWVLGMGYEHALRARWSAKAELLHLDLGRLSSASNNLVGDNGVYSANTLTTTARLHASQLRLGLNKRW